MSAADALREMIREVVREELAKLAAPKPEHDTLTIKQASVVARVTPKTIRRWIDEDGLKSSGAGKRIRVRGADLLAFMDGDPNGADEDAIVADIVRRRR